MYELFQDVLEVVIRIITVIMIIAAIFMVAELHQRSEEVVYIAPDAKALIKELWQDEWPMAHAIIMAESRYKPDVIGDEHLTYISDDGEVYGDSVGIFQIRTFKDRPHRELLKDPYINIRYAFYMWEKAKKKSKKATGWEPWGSYNNGTYKKFLKKEVIL